MGRQSAARAPEATRSKLVAAAARLFNSVGYFGTDSNRIARAAGYAPGTFYVHFADKLEIFLAVYQQWAELEWLAVVAALAPDSPRPAASARAASAVLQHHRDWRVFRASLRALTATDERVHQARLAQRRQQIAQTSALLRARGVTVNLPRLYACLLHFEILCDAVADGDAAALGVKERDILALLAGEVADLFGAS